MKTLSKKFLVFLLAIFMVTPLLSQPALASDILNEDDPGDIVVVPNFDPNSLTATEPVIAEPDVFDEDVPTPYLMTEGNRVVSIRAYPLAMDPDEGTTVYYTNIYASINYSTYYDSLAGFALSQKQTLSLMQRMLNALAASSSYQDYLLAGWHFEADIWFYYSKPEYMTYQYRVSQYASDEIKQVISNPDFVGTFKMDFGYPTRYGIDPLNDPYYVGVTGAFYCVGDLYGRAFSASVSFNSPNPTNPD